MDVRTAEDTLAFSGDKYTDLDYNLLLSYYATLNNAIDSLKPRDVDIDAIFSQYLYSPSPSPSPSPTPTPTPTPSPDDTASELSGATLFNASRDLSSNYSKSYTETSRSLASEISPENETARDQEDPYRSAKNGSRIYLQVSQPKITLRLNFQNRGLSRKEKKGKGRIRGRGKSRN